MPIYDEETGTYYKNDDDGNMVQVYQSDDEGSSWSPTPVADAGSTAVAPLDLSTYNVWDWQNVAAGGAEGQGAGIFSQIYGGNPYNGRVTDWSHISPTNYQANQYANETREKLWAHYNSLPAGQKPALNPDQFAKQKWDTIAASFIGEDGNPNSEGMRNAAAGINTLALQNALVSEYIPGSQPSYTPEQVQQFGAARAAEVPTYNTFTQQAQGSDLGGKLLQAGLMAAFGALVGPSILSSFGGDAVAATTDIAAAEQAVAQQAAQAAQAAEAVAPSSGALEQLIQPPVAPVAPVAPVTTVAPTAPVTLSEYSLAGSTPSGLGMTTTSPTALLTPELSQAAGILPGLETGTGIGLGATTGSILTDPVLLTPSITGGATGIPPITGGLESLITQPTTQPTMPTEQPTAPPEQPTMPTQPSVNDIDDAAQGGVLNNPYGTPATTTVGPGGTATAASSAIGRIISQLGGGPEASASDWASVLGSIGSSALGMYGAGKQADAYENVANQYLGMGQPYRDRLNASYAPGFSMADQPDFKNALDISSQSVLSKLSATGGNPYGNPGALAEADKYVAGSLALPQLNTYRSQLGTFGQLGVNTGGTANMNAASQTGNLYDALGYGLRSATQPDNQYKGVLDQLLKQSLSSGNVY